MLKITFKIVTLGFFVLLIASNSQAQSLTDSLMKCGQVQNSLKRLVCYDAIVNGMKGDDEPETAKSVPAPIPKATVITPTIVNKTVPDTLETPAVSITQDMEKPQTKDSYFGLEQQQLAELKTENKIYATVAEIGKTARRTRLFTLDNGQVWRESEKVFLKIKVDDIVSIERGVMGSFHLSKENVNQRMKVMRVE